MTDNRATTARRMRLNFSMQADRDRAEIERVQDDPKFSDEGRKAAITPIRDRAQNRYDACVRDTKALVDAARSAYATYLPRASQAKAALEKPERAAAMKALASGTSVADLLQLTQLAAATMDLPAAHGIRLALNASVPTGTLQESEIGAVHDALDLIVYPEARAARAEYIAAKVEYDILSGAGPMNDAAGDLFANPVAAINRAREATAIEQEDGTLRHLSDNERLELQRLAGTVDDPDTGAAA